MCGIVGFLGATQNPTDVLHDCTNEIFRRGPDSYGYWSDSENNIFLGHRRLAILDLSSAGHQPMVSMSGRYVIVFNGEIYNHLELRSLTGFSDWRGDSDTETLLFCIENWGFEETLKSVVGMFAIAVWDRLRNELLLARDRVGEKPLYYGWQKKDNVDVFLFGSELKALKKHPAFAAEISRNSLARFFRKGCISAPYSIYEGISKIMPGTYLRVSQKSRSPEIYSYWDLSASIDGKIQPPFAGSFDEAADELETLLTRVIKGQMIADVPLGAFLSGGIDSSLIVALMQKNSDSRIKTFTIGFDHQIYDEAPYARAVAKHLGSEHYEFYIKPSDTLNVIDMLPEIYDEPFSDSSQIPTYLVSKMAKTKVSVVLSGDGGDEVFAGYNRYKFVNDMWGEINRLPLPVRILISSFGFSLSVNNWNNLFSFLKKNFLIDFKASNPGEKIHKASSAVRSNSVHQLYDAVSSHWLYEDHLVVGVDKKLDMRGKCFEEIQYLNDIQRMMLLDFSSYLPDDVLVKVDRASMFSSLETRAPLLDHRLIEFAWTLPQGYKINESGTKQVLRAILDKYVPRELIDRPKKGFGVPIDHWLRGPLRSWCEELLNEDRLKREGYLNPLPVKKKWKEHLSGIRNWEHDLWDVLMFQSWYEHQ